MSTKPPEDSRRSDELEELVHRRDVRGLVEHLHKHFAETPYARDTMSSLGTDGVPYLIEAYGSGDATTRCYAAVALGDIGDQRATEPLLAYLSRNDVRKLKGPEYRVWADTVHALGQLQCVDAVELLVGILTVPSVDVREDAAAALGVIGDPRAVTPLIQLLTDERPPVNFWAASALKEIGGPDAEAAVREWESGRN